MTKAYHTQLFFGIAQQGPFFEGMNKIFGALRTIAGSFAGDNLITFGRNLSFLSDEKFMAAVDRHCTTAIEKAIVWRIAVVAWGAAQGMRLEGDFVEIACYKGITARIVYEYTDMATHPDRRYFLYDLFEHDANMPHHTMPEHSLTLYDQVKARFADAPNVVITQGFVPQSLEIACPDKIAFMHLDLNNADAEIGALEKLFERMVPGAVMILDDYGWLGYRAQKLAEDPWFAARGYRVLELPTGQGMVIR